MPHKRIEVKRTCYQCGEDFTTLLYPYEIRDSRRGLFCSIQCANVRKKTGSNRSLNAREWDRRNPEKRRAYSQLNRAVRIGAVTPQPCERCGVKPAEAHHDDYGKALDVRWLCHRHHMEVHREARRA